MLATAARELGPGEWAVEPKLDGWRALVYVDGAVTVRTRRGRDVTRSLPELARLGDHLDGRQVVLDGELVVGQGLPGDFYRLGPRDVERDERDALALPVEDASPAPGRAIPARRALPGAPAPTRRARPH